MNWYYVEQGQQAGPVDDAQLDQLRAAGRIQADTLVWRDGLANWIPFSEARGGQAPAGGGLRLSTPAAGGSGEPTEAVCTECNGIFPKSEMIRYGTSHVCANCKPAFMQKIAEGAKINTGELNYAGFWIRFAAKFLDGLILGILVVVPLVIIFVMIGVGAAASTHSSLDPSRHFLPGATTNGAELIGNLVGVFAQFIMMGVNVLYAGFFVGKYGATPGKMACKLLVVDAQGNPVTYGRAFGRGFAEILSRLICSIGYLIAAFDGEKRALHDHICGTRVVYK